MPSPEDLARPFAVAIHAKGRALTELELSPQQQARIRESISVDIRKFDDVVHLGGRPHRVSEAAMRAAKEMGVDLSSLGWHDQPKFDTDRAVFHREHMTTVKAIRDECLQQDSVDGVLMVLASRLNVVWILKAEDEKLRKLGFGSLRPDPIEAYRKAGIVLVELP